jgi:menaquinone-dependent protoporphyrinogen oxidase
MRAPASQVPLHLAGGAPVRNGEAMDILVAYATRHGSTAGIAEHIATTLTGRGHRARAVPVEQVEDVETFDAVVLGGAAYMFHWLKPAVRFAKKHHAELASRPVWLFSSGPLGTDLVDAEGGDVLETTRPREFDELTTLLEPRGEQVFFGAYDPDAPPIGITERLTRRLPAARDSFPVGDFRDWDAITAWAEQIAADLDGNPPEASRGVSMTGGGPR